MPSLNTKTLVIIALLIVSLPLNFALGFFLGYKVAFTKLQNLGPYHLPREAVVTEVVDGDTIEITSPFKIGPGLNKVSARSVRYLGIDAPNPGEENFQEAKTANERLVLGKKVTLEYDTPQNDKYGRILAWIWFEGKLINQEMLNTGLAQPLIMEDQKLKYNLTLPPNQ